MSHVFHHSAFPPLRDPMQAMHRRLMQVLWVGVLLLVANAAVVVFVH